MCVHTQLITCNQIIIIKTKCKNENSPQNTLQTHLKPILELGHTDDALVAKTTTKSNSI